MYSHLHIKEERKVIPSSHSHQVIPSTPLSFRAQPGTSPLRIHTTSFSRRRESRGDGRETKIPPSRSVRGLGGCPRLTPRHSRAGGNPEGEGMGKSWQSFQNHGNHGSKPTTSFSRRRESRGMYGRGNIMAIISKSWQSWFKTHHTSSPRRRESRAEGTGKTTAIMAPHNRRNTNCQTAIVATTADTPATMKANGAPHTCANVPINSAPSACAPQVKFIKLITRPRN